MPPVNMKDMQAALSKAERDISALKLQLDREKANSKEAATAAEAKIADLEDTNRTLNNQINEMSATAVTAGPQEGNILRDFAEQYAWAIRDRMMPGNHHHLFRRVFERTKSLDYVYAMVGWLETLWSTQSGKNPINVLRLDVKQRIEPLHRIHQSKLQAQNKQPTAAAAP